MGFEEELDKANDELRALSPGIESLNEFSLSDPEAVLKHHLQDGGLALLGTIAFMRFRELSPEINKEIDEILEAADEKMRPYSSHALLLQSKDLLDDVFANPDKYGVPQEMRGSREGCDTWIWVNLEKLPDDNAALSVARKEKEIAVWAWCEVFKRLRNEREAGALQ